MTETAESSAYGVMASWFTPSCLFLFINLVIGTIAIISRFANTTKRQHQLVRSPSLLERLASLNLCYHKQYEPTTTTLLHSHVNPVQSRDESRLDRVRSFNLDFYNVDNIERPDPIENSDSPQLDRVPSSSLGQVKFFNLNIYKSEIEGLDLVHRPDSSQIGRVSSTSLLDRVRSFNLNFNKVEIEKSSRVQQQVTRAPSILERLKSSLSFDRSMSVTEPESEVTGGGELVEETEEEGVDAKADDFINRFRQQLRLQRLDSIIRYRDMLKRY
ncbi:hypothetical protein AAZX31_15G161800 [Glycine max]|uniref:DUF4408 domain-containing protein n=1 Tax=Glycine soja TaxID=3848 RepID=A0A445GUU3_GLYSO|nr:pathogen-associated molecular patterns-induced protein A70-like [Glycine soja]KAG4946509.1 hypothetical protein JHK87_042516 [Glycine soja]KAH1209387.1 hypothetical protein GmHk_15G043936 [Glycine max]RZB64984.1 hypothetical protein D0Y65_041158 [Glycine soja]